MSPEAGPSPMSELYLDHLREGLKAACGPSWGGRGGGRVRARVTVSTRIRVGCWDLYRAAGLGQQSRCIGASVHLPAFHLSSSLSLNLMNSCHSARHIGCTPRVHNAHCRPHPGHHALQTTSRPSRPVLVYTSRHRRPQSYTVSLVPVICSPEQAQPSC